MTALDFSNSGGSTQIFIKCNTTWQVQVDKDATWLSLTSPSGNGDGKVTVKAESNNNTTARNGILTFTYGKNKVDVKVTQSAEEPYVTISPNKLEFGISGGNEKITVNSNTEWTAFTNDTWMEIKPYGGDRNGTLTVTVSENSGVERNGTITFLYEGKSSQFNVKQEGYYLNLSPERLTDIKALGEKKEVTVSSNSEWTAWSDAEWIKMSDYYGTTGTTIDVTIAPNTTSRSRNGTISFSSKAGQKSITIQQVAGTTSPFLITNVEFAAWGDNENILVDYAKNPWFKKYSTKYVNARITCEAYVKGSYTLYVKITSPDGPVNGLYSGGYSDRIYTYMEAGNVYTYASSRFQFYEGNYIKYYTPGKYTFDFYYNNQKIASGSYNVEY